ncbi:MAG: cellulose biosynthesis cyclic di-GMP-binding regulatory protein BcsB [Terracidiphilus sp.]
MRDGAFGRWRSFFPTSRTAALRIVFAVPGIEEQELLARALYSRADAWIGAEESKEVDRPLVSLGRVIVLSGHGLLQTFRSLLPDKGAAEAAAVPAQTTAALILVACALGLCGRAGALGRPQAAGAQAAAARQTSGTAAGGPAAARQARAGAGAGARAETNAGGPSSVNGTAAQTFAFTDLNQQNAIEMHGPHSYYSLHFTISHELVPRQAVLKLSYWIDPSLDPHSTSLGVSLNGLAVTTIGQGAGKNGLAFAEIAIPEVLLVRSNTLTFEFTGSAAMQSEAESRARVLCRIFPRSTLAVSGDRLRLGDDLSRLPLPIFDSELETETTIPFVFLSAPSRKALEAGGIVASWLGLNAGARPPLFAASVGGVPAGNPVVIASDRSRLPAALEIPAGDGPVVALRPNPSDPFGSVLVVAGAGDAELLSAAQALALTGRARAANRAAARVLTGDTAELAPVALPPARAKDDAPLWMQAGKTNPLANCQGATALETFGGTDGATDGLGPARVSFRVPPDLFYGEEQNLNLVVNYRYDARQAATGSTLRTLVNGNLVHETPLPPGAGEENGQRTIPTPVADLRPFGNTVQFNFDFAAANRDPAQDSQLSGAVLCGSKLDLRGLGLWTRMPNLELFANAGFPFTQRADLAQTTVVLPSVPRDGEIALYLQLMSHFGEETGYPGLRVTVADPDTAIAQGRDYLILGAVGNQPAFGALEASLPVTIDANGIHVKAQQGIGAQAAMLKDAAWRWGETLIGNAQAAAAAPEWGGAPEALIEEIQSPASPDRSIVVVALKQNDAEATFASALAAGSQSKDMSGPVSLLRRGRFDSYAVYGRSYHVGAISWYETVRIYLAQYFLLLLAAATAFSFLLAYYAYEWMAWHAAERVDLARLAREDD